MIESNLILHRKGILGSDEAQWAGRDIFPTNTSIALPLDVQPIQAGNGNVSFVTNAPNTVDGLNKAARFNANNSQLSFADNTPFNLNNYTDFCIEAWTYLTGASIIACLWHPGDAPHCVFSFTADSGQLAISSTGAGWWYTTQPAGTYPFNTWQHVAMTRQGSTARIWYNGNKVYELTTTLNPLPGNMPAYLGYRNEGTGMIGGSYMAGFRMTRGVPRYTKNFIPSTLFY